MITCINCEELLLAYINNELEHDGKEAINLHLKGCDNCSKELIVRKELLEVLSTINLQPAPTKNCFDIEVLAEYVFGDMDEEKKKAVNKHISTCGYCLCEINELKDAEKDIPDRIKYKPLPASYYHNKYSEILMDKIPRVNVAPALAASQGNKTVCIEGVYSSIEVTQSEDGKIRLIDPSNCPEELLTIRWNLNEEEFFYRIFGIYENGEKRELLSGSDEFLPIEIENTDTDYLIVFISQKKTILEIEIGRLSSIIAGETEDRLEDVICIFVTIKRD